MSTADAASRARWQDKIGFMQGRLSAPVNGRIQAFPWAEWREEFGRAEALGFHLLEWTLDHDRLYENPLLTAEGQHEIHRLSMRHAVKVASLTGDCFMQAPFWKSKAGARAVLQRDFAAVAESCHRVGISFIVVPLVDDGRLENDAQEDILVTFFNAQLAWLKSLGLRIVFESDFSPAELSRLMSRLDAGVFGVNYDIGNSAALGFDPAEEFKAYSARVMNVHVKDRVLGGTTVPLGTGNARFGLVFDALRRIGYVGNYILQTPRAPDGDHAAALAKFRNMTADWLSSSAASVQREE